jgi:hypothetical protein
MNSDEYSYGWDGDQRYLEEMMALKNNQSESLKELRLALNSTFSKINCFLMPHPGLKVAKGNFVPSDIVPDFVRNLNEFAAHVFSPNNLQIKKIGCQPVNGRKMMEYFKYFLDSFGDKERLRPETIHEATCRANWVADCSPTASSPTPSSPTAGSPTPSSPTPGSPTPSSPTPSSPTAGSLTGQFTDTQFTDSRFTDTQFTDTQFADTQFTDSRFTDRTVHRHMNFLKIQ